MKTMELATQKFILCKAMINIQQLQEELLNSNDENLLVIVLNEKSEISYVYSAAILLRTIIKDKLNNQILSECNIPGKTFYLTQEDISLSVLSRLSRISTDTLIIIDNNGFPIGIIDHLQYVLKLYNYFEREYQELNKGFSEYQQVFQYLDEEIFITDNQGRVVRLNPAAERVCGVKEKDVIGWHVKDLEEKKIIDSNVTMKVLQQRKTINIIQNLKTGRSVIGTGIPVYNKEGDLIRVICTSKDVEQINILKEEVERKERELDLLHQEIFYDNEFVYISEEMTDIKNVLVKVAPLDSLVLIQGESGVGKEVVARALHYLSQRRNRPFIKINCGGLPETLLESELFGYESGAFTGASRKGKVGKIELACKGTLFLDEIGELPLNLQVKLLDFLQDMTINHIGGTKEIKIDARIIAATNRNLEEMVKNGTFRKDLYYRLNIIPMFIPPLRCRKDDIPVLADYFLKKLNRKYHLTRRLSPEIIKVFMKYKWPGNVRELAHIIERVLAITDSDDISLSYIADMLDDTSHNNGKVICAELMPLKLAKNQLEKQLVVWAYEVYGSTYKVAKVLKVNQSTVVRLLQKHGHQKFPLPG
jgi:PAS domain S-box-containing protein